MNEPQASRSALTVWLLIFTLLVPVLFGVGLVYLPGGGAARPRTVSPVSHFPASTLRFEAHAVGKQTEICPQITNVRLVDLDKDGRLDILVCDAQHNRVYWYRQLAEDQWEEIPVGEELNAPAGVIAVDLDGDGDLDLVVAVLGSVYPSDERIGQVVWLENLGNRTFRNHVLLDQIRRVSDVQAGDLDGDGDLDLAVAVFGYHHGEVLWLENKGKGIFRDHLLFTTQGPSHVPIGDFDGDGDLDLVALVSQDHEEVWAFENQGGGKLVPRLLHRFVNFDLGGAGLLATDLDKDGKLDLLVVAGDNLEVNHHYPQPWHGCIWLRNQGDWRFEDRRLARVGGVYGVAVGDLDGDGDEDIVLACMFNDWNAPGSASLVLLENNGQQEFTAKMLADRPIHLATVAVGDLNGDGRLDIVAGALFLSAPRDRIGRVTRWMRLASP